jgi:hypothetical protein
MHWPSERREVVLWEKKIVTFFGVGVFAGHNII